MCSEKGARIDAQMIPLSTQMTQIAGDNALDWALTGGEDFELCFTLSPESWQLLQQASARTQHCVAINKIGTINAGTGIELFRDSKWQKIAAKGFNHFSN